MKHAVTFLHTFHYACAVKSAGIARLTTSGRIESRLVERHRRPITHTLAGIDYAGFKLDEVRVGVIKTFGCGHKTLRFLFWAPDFSSSCIDKVAAWFCPLSSNDQYR